VLLAADDLESIEATLELLADTQAQERIAAGKTDFAVGDVLDEQQVRALINERYRARPE
jgi:antitoxin YefM